MKNKIFIVLFLFVSATLTAQINLNKVGNQVKKSADEKINRGSSTTTSSSTPTSGGVTRGTTTNSTASIEVPKGTKNIYVSLANGSNRNDGSINAPLKDIQKAVDNAPEGAVIMVSEGNYLGNLDCGYIKISKYVSVIGGYSNDFSQRDPIKYKTTIQPGANAGGTNANNGLFDIYVRGKRD